MCAKIQVVIVWVFRVKLLYQHTSMLNYQVLFINIEKKNIFIIRKLQKWRQCESSTLYLTGMKKWKFMLQIITYRNSTFHCTVNNFYHFVPSVYKIKILMGRIC
jgi:hypothetical protein